MTRIAIVCLVAVIGASCATTTRTSAPTPTTWRKTDASVSSVERLSVPAGRIPVYVASFGLAPSVAERHPELTRGQVGLGVSNRIVDALYDTERFSFREEKAEIVGRLTEMLDRVDAPQPSEAEFPDAVRWLLYGEIVDVKVARDEKVRGVVGVDRTETSVTVQIRLVDRQTKQFVPVTATGSDVSKTRGDELDPTATSAATGSAVRRATEQLVERIKK